MCVLYTFIGGLPSAPHGGAVPSPPQGGGVPPPTYPEGQGVGYGGVGYGGAVTQQPYSVPFNNAQVQFKPPNYLALNIFTALCCCFICGLMGIIEGMQVSIYRNILNTIPDNILCTEFFCIRNFFYSL